MEDTFCPNYNTCQLIKDKEFNIEEDIKLSYITNYCKAGKEKWCICKRLITKSEINFCPDFVLPDTTLTPDEIIDKFDSENLN